MDVAYLPIHVEGFLQLKKLLSQSCAVILDFAMWTDIHTCMLERAIIIISPKNYAFDCIPSIVPANA